MHKDFMYKSCLVHVPPFSLCIKPKAETHSVREDTNPKTLLALFFWLQLTFLSGCFHAIDTLLTNGHVNPSVQPE